jgi:hypothetical protein
MHSLLNQSSVNEKMMSINDGSYNGYYIFEKLKDKNNGLPHGSQLVKI